MIRVAISNYRIRRIEDNVIRFRYKDRGKNTWKTLALDAMGFVRRFLQHVLPKGFMQIGHYCFLNPNYALPIEEIRELISFIHDIMAIFIWMKHATDSLSLPLRTLIIAVDTRGVIYAIE